MRTIDDPRAMRALAHPVRQALLEALFREGPLTATRAAELLDDSPGNISWHLQMLAKYGYIVEAGTGRGRARPWKLAGQTNSIHVEGGSTGGALAAETALMAGLVRNDLRRFNDWLAQWTSYDAGWREASFTTHVLTYLTVQELEQVSAGLVALVMPFRERVTDPSKRPPGSLPVQIVALGHPIVPASPAADEQQE